MVCWHGSWHQGDRRDFFRNNNDCVFLDHGLEINIGSCLSNVGNVGLQKNAESDDCLFEHETVL